MQYLSFPSLFCLKSLYLHIGYLTIRKSEYTGKLSYIVNTTSVGYLCTELSSVFQVFEVADDKTDQVGAHFHRLLEVGDFQCTVVLPIVD